jgi:hypothetical protein
MPVPLSYVPSSEMPTERCATTKKSSPGWIEKAYVRELVPS